jgi:peptidyl-prolyl cis-trans isomerase SurA
VRRPRFLLAIAAGAFGMLHLSTPSRAEEPQSTARVVVNRIVAIVDDDVITLAELRRRALPALKRLAAIVPPDKRTGEEAKIYKEWLQILINERLIVREARKLRMTIASTDVDATIDSIAKSMNTTREKVMAAAIEQGYSEAQYREEIVGQLLTKKIMLFRMRDEFSKLDKDPEKSSKQIDKIIDKFNQQMRANVFIEVRL